MRHIAEGKTLLVAMLCIVCAGTIGCCVHRARWMKRNSSPAASGAANA